MEKENKLIRIKIISRSGHDDWEGYGPEALNKIMEETANGRWAYIDGVFVDPELLTATILENADDITLTNSLYGG